MVRLILIIVVFFQSVDLYSQIYESADSLSVKRKNISSNTIKSNINIALSLINDTLYFMDFTNYLHDMVHRTFISYGKVKVVGKMYYLTDIPCGFQIVLEKKDQDSFLVKKGFYFLKDECLKYNEYYEVDTVGFSVSDIKREVIEQEKCERYYIANKTNEPVPFQLGAYGGKCVFEVKFSMNNKYEISFSPWKEESFLLSSGSWKKRGNELELYDSDLDYSFLLLIRNEDLIRVHFPTGACFGVFLFPLKNQMYPFIVR